MIAPLSGCCTCIVRLVSLMWWNLPRNLNGSRTVPFDNRPKRGLIRRYVSPEKRLEEIDFEMLPVPRPANNVFKKKFRLVFGRDRGP
jgi:hypothetical protein